MNDNSALQSVCTVYKARLYVKGSDLTSPCVIESKPSHVIEWSGSTNCVIGKYTASFSAHLNITQGSNCCQQLKVAKSLGGTTLNEYYGVQLIC